MSDKRKRISALLGKDQVIFVDDLIKRIEKECHKKVSRCEIMGILVDTLTCIEPKIGSCTNEKEIGSQLLKCLKKSTRKGKNWEKGW